jgi:hypothetical protein
MKNFKAKHKIWGDMEDPNSFKIRNINFLKM